MGFAPGPNEELRSLDKPSLPLSRSALGLPISGIPLVKLPWPEFTHIQTLEQELQQGVMPRNNTTRALGADGWTETLPTLVQTVKSGHDPTSRIN